MAETKRDPIDWLVRHWRLVVLVLWAIVAAWLVHSRWGAISGFMLGDTDDNLRMAQVRALIEGQGWYDLRQYRLNPPVGADIHWSRLVDLPIAGIKLALSPLLGGRHAELVAVAVAPMLPMLVAMLAMAGIVRRIVHPRAFWLAVALIACAGSARGMWHPLRLDHHGWQLALLACAVAALVDPKRIGGGILLGIATALSLAIGLEMLLYLALAGAVTVCLWIRDREEAPRLLAYGASLGGGTAFAFLVFASEANRAPVCDALSPVWLSVMAGAGAIAALLALAPAGSRLSRFGLAAVAGGVLAAFFVLAWPDCLGRLEGSSPELERLWLDRVREAMPVWRHGARLAALIVTLPVAGLLGYGLMIWTNRRDPGRLTPWLAVAFPAFLSASLLMWQTRAGPAAQLLAIPGASALAWTLLVWIQSKKWAVVRIIGISATIVIISGLGTWLATRLFPEQVSEYRQRVNLANSRCPTLGALRPVAQQPRGTVLTFVDLGPRLITTTHHDALAGPYHRNGAQIIDVMRAWRGDAANARETIARYRVDYVLICPDYSESTIYRSEAPEGFYAMLAQGDAPDWLTPIPLPENSPYRMWRVNPQ